ncbi:serine-threonine protein kinase [Streptomyces sp. RerS4]|uniref:serine-threonine protein kinase n=1 Tax=Streptomyces sp. RerS4 TaxID=2942449 RepID=UPI00201C3A34|nr:serine-threonine protein kinase [Streptomyces sp. RerS4]UQX00438.1 serine-threonine protein kinase [Streptomyces sp. RerS4]
MVGIGAVGGIGAGTWRVARAVGGIGVGGIGVGPYRELSFDAQGDVDPTAQEAVARIEATDLLVFAHGWNSDRSTSTRLYDRFFAPFPGLVGTGVRLGYVGVVWPSIRFADEPIPDFDPPGALVGPGYGTALDPDTRRALGEFWPGREAQVDRVAELLEERPESEAALVEFGALVRELAGVDGAATAAAARVPALFSLDVLAVCRDLAGALVEAGCGEVAGGGGEAGGGEVAAAFAIRGGPRALWSGAKELLRQATYYEMKKRAGVVGEHGLGPFLTELALRRPALRVHLIGHSFGARLVSFALRATADGSRHVASLTLLQGAFSHYAFSGRLPHDARRGGSLAGLQRRVTGPVVACHSAHDTALGLFYPMASRMAGDSAGLLGFAERWGAIGHGGVREVSGAPRLSLDAALRDGLPTTGCVSVDAGSVVRRGGAPSGAHSDICHEELARIVVAAGRMGR